MKPTLFTFVLSLAALPVLAAAQDQAGLPPETAADPAPAGRPASAAPAAEQDPTLAKLKNLKNSPQPAAKESRKTASVKIWLMLMIIQFFIPTILYLQLSIT